MSPTGDMHNNVYAVQQRVALGKLDDARLSPCGDNVGGPSRANGHFLRVARLAGAWAGLLPGALHCARAATRGTSLRATLGVERRRDRFVPCGLVPFDLG